MTHLEVIQRVWPEWAIIEKIGEGSFGQVFKAEKESFGIKQESAIKIVRIPSDEAELDKVRSSFGLDDEELRDYFYPQLDKLKKEIELMMKLNDNNIVKIHDFEIKESFDSKVGWYILIRMELLECLERYVRETSITVGDLLAIGEDILSCLEICEKNNIIHRDIKPANLFRNDKGVYKLGDFGIARDMSESAGSLSYKGTENYMAPEVYMGQNYNSTIDIYALGIVLYKLLNKNRLPFMNQEKLTSASIEKAFQKRNTGVPFPKPVQSSISLYEVIKKMCEYKPKDRFQTAAEAKKALIEYKNRAGEELETILDINNRLRKSTNTRSQAEVLEKSIIKEEAVTQIEPEAKPIERAVPTETQTNEKNTALEIPGANIENTEEPIQSQLFNKSYDIEQRDEDWGNKTRSLYQEKYQEKRQLKQEAIKSPDTRQGLIKKDNEVKKKKTKITFILGIEAAVIAIAVGFVLAFGGKNVFQVAEAREIYADDNIFVIDKEQYRGKYIEHTTKFCIEDKMVEITGIYIGATKSGKPDGYGAFYYREEGTDKDGKYSRDCIHIGTWEKGNLVVSEGKDSVKERIFFDEEYDDTGDKLIYEYVTTGDWGIGNFVGNPKGIYESTYINKGTGEVEEMNFKGTFEVAGYSYNLLNGDCYFNGSLYYKGEFRDDKPYNGTYYDEDGKETSKVVDGKWVQPN